MPLQDRARFATELSTALVNPDLAEFATLCGALGVSVTNRADLDSALTTALSHDGPSLVHVHAGVALV